MSESEQELRSSTDKKQEYKQRYYQKEMTDIFESLELQLYEKFKEVDHVMCCISREASSCQIPGEYREKFVRQKIIDMFEQIAE